MPSRFFFDVFIAAATPFYSMNTVCAAAMPLLMLSAASAIRHHD